MNLVVEKARKFLGSVRPPSDKSITHRSLLVASICKGESVVRNPLLGEDPMATIGCLKQLGCEFDIQNNLVRVLPSEGYVQPDGPLDCGNSGTTMRLLSGLVASRRLDVELRGDESLSRRPMGRISKPLQLMGAELEGETPPLHVVGNDHLRGIEYDSPVASAQVKSAILLAGLRATGKTTVFEPSRSRDHTERILSALGAKVSSGLEAEGRAYASIQPQHEFSGFEVNVPADISSAAFWMVAAAIIRDGDVRLAEVGINPTRTGILDVFEQAGIRVEREALHDQMNEPTANLRIRGIGGGQPFRISGSLVPRLIDEIPVLAVLATQMHGTTLISDARELRVKESDRITAIAEGLKSMGANVEIFEDGMAIEGPVKLTGAKIEAKGDHRIAMAFAVAGLIAEGPTEIVGSETIQTSFPSFETDLARLCS